MTTKDEAIKALHEASLSIACLGADWTEHFEDESVTKNHRKWVLKDQEGLTKRFRSHSRSNYYFRKLLRPLHSRGEFQCQKMKNYLMIILILSGLVDSF